MYNSRNQVLRAASLSGRVTLCVALIGAALVLAVLPQVAFATQVSEDIIEDTTWTQAGSPYEVVKDISVIAGVTLTIDPGVTVSFSPAVGLSVRGRITAAGSPGSPIEFSGPGGPFAWDGIEIVGSPGAPLTGSSFSWVTFQNGGLDSSADGILYLEQASIAVDNCLFQGGSSHGLIARTNAVADIADTSFFSNRGYAAYFEDGSVNPVLANLSAAGNDHDGVAIGGSATLAGLHVWEAMGLPYIVRPEVIRVGPGAELRIESGVTVQFEPSAAMDVEGTLTAIGTAAHRITLTGLSGAWDGLAVEGLPGQPTAGSVLDYVTLEQGGTASASSANLYLTYTTVTISHSAIRGGLSHGLLGWTQGSAAISDTAFEDNGGFAAYFADGTVDPVLSGLTATGNDPDAVGIGGAAYLATDHTWEDSGLPYVIAGNQIVEAGATLTVAPGVTVQFQQHTGLQVRGRLTAAGTQAEPILLTGQFSGGLPSRGWWDGVWIQGTAQVPSLGSELSQTTVEYAGYGGGPSLYVGFGSAGVEGSTIREGAGSGVAVGLGGSGTAIQDSQVVANSGKGITVVGSYGLPTRHVSIRGTAVYDNGGLGIDLDGDGVTLNDHGDGDGGTNELMNFPVLSVEFGGGNTTISGILDTGSPDTATVDLYASQQPDPSGHGQGRVLLGSATPNASGAFQLVIGGPLPFPFVSATATDADGCTSEFARTVTAGPAHLLYLPMVLRVR